MTISHYQKTEHETNVTKIIAMQTEQIVNTLTHTHTHSVTYTYRYTDRQVRT